MCSTFAIFISIIYFCMSTYQNKQLYISKKFLCANLKVVTTLNKVAFNFTPNSPVLQIIYKNKI